MEPEPAYGQSLGDRNPILPGFWPDPSICRAGEDYYLVCSSFEYAPGVPIFHSRGLGGWRQIGNVLARAGQLRLPADTLASRGIYAPTIRHHDGRFWVVTTNVTLDRHLIVTATDPAGPWSDPVYLDLPHVDPSLAWDDDGTCWMTVSGVESYRIDPRTGLRCPMMERISVGLPAPLRPTRLTMAPRSMRMEKPRSAGIDWISTTRLSISSSGLPAVIWRLR